MIKGIYFSIGCNWEAKRKSILLISESLIYLLRALAKEDNRFDIPIFISELGKHVDLNLKNENIVNQLSKSILISKELDIKKNEGVSDVDASFSRDFGFSLSFGFKNQDISLSTRIGSSQAEGLSFNFSKDFEATKEWYLRLVKCVVKNTDAFYGGMHLKVYEYTKHISHISYPIGLITYFSNSFYISEDKYLTNMIVEREEKGIFIIEPEEGITSNKEKYEHFKAKLLRLNEIEIRRLPLPPKTSNGSPILIKVNGQWEGPFTWHHHEDGTTMMPVIQEIHNSPNHPHTGGRRIVAFGLEGLFNSPSN